MKRFLLAPIAALALLSVVATPTFAQAADPVAELAQLRMDHRAMHRAYTALERQLKHCQMPETSEIQQVLASSDTIANRAGALAKRLGGKQHVQALAIENVADVDFWMTTNMRLPEICYVPPAE